MKKSLLALALVLGIFLGGCGGGNADPKAGIDTFLKALKSSNYELAQEVSQGEAELPETKEEQDLYKIMLKNLSWTLGEEKIDGDKAVVSASIKNKTISQAFEHALHKALGEMISEDLSEEKAGNLFLEQLPKSIEQVDFTTTELEINLYKKDEKWIIERTDELMTALLGGNSTELPNSPDE